MLRKNTPGQEFLQCALRTGALEFIPEGRKLESGRLSPYFFNSGKFDSGRTMLQLVSAYAKVIRANIGTGLEFDLLYGPPYKGTILVPAIAIKLETIGCGNIRFCTSRKEAKDHGEGGSLIGAPIKDTSRVLIIDDVITDGGTKREAVEFIRQQGGEPVGLIIAFDRQERGTGKLSAVQEFERKYNIPVYAIATLADLMSFTLGIDNKDMPNLRKIIDYKERYGVL